MQCENEKEWCSIVYLQDGIRTCADYILPEDQKSFFIQICDDESETRFYPGDTVVREIDAELATLGESFRRLIFLDDESYYSERKKLPMFIATAGLSSDFSMSKESYEEALNDHDLYQKYKPHFYLADVQYLISSVQNLVIGMDANLIDFYRSLSEMRTPNRLFHENGTYVVRGECAERIISILGSYFVKMYSIMDLITKIAYEFENPCPSFDGSPRLRSNGVLYNNKNRLRMNNQGSTIFVKDDLLTEIETLRNEIVHNGMWEDGRKVFIDIEKESVVARYVLYPDMEKGRFISYANRHHFFSKGIKVNDVLPNMHIHFLSRLLNTIFHIRSIAPNSDM